MTQLQPLPATGRHGQARDSNTLSAIAAARVPRRGAVGPMEAVTRTPCRGGPFSESVAAASSHGSSNLKYIWPVRVRATWMNRTRRSAMARMTRTSVTYGLTVTVPPCCARAKFERHAHGGLFPSISPSLLPFESLLVVVLGGHLSWRRPRTAFIPSPRLPSRRPAFQLENLPLFLVRSIHSPLLSKVSQIFSSYLKVKRGSRRRHHRRPAPPL